MLPVEVGRRLTASTRPGSGSTPSPTATTTQTPAATRTQGSDPAATASSDTPDSSSAAGAPGSTSGGATQSTASRVASARVSLLEATAARDAAQADLTAAVLRSPRAGTVATVPFAVGSTVSTGDAITLVGKGAARVTVDVPLASVPSVAVGQAARVTPAGAVEPLPGRVEAVSLLPTSTGSTTYPVTVLVAQPTAALAAGSQAAVSLVLATVEDVVTVPNSALTRSATGSTASVRVRAGGLVTSRSVETGAVGALLTEITSGLQAGDELVIADLAQELPANSTTTTRVGGQGGAGPVPGGAPPGGAGARPGG